MEDMKLSSLEGVGPVTTRKLSDAGIHNVMDLIVRGPVEISEITGMEKDTAEKIVNKARQHLVDGGKLAGDFVSASEIYDNRQKIGRITTGTDCLDSLFGGGLETQALTEVYGEFGCGKTQFAHTMSVMVQKSKEEGGLEGGVLYIDTENTFRPERIVSIAKAHGMDPLQVLQNITVARAHSSSHQTLILEGAGPVIEANNIKLIVADSAVGLFRSEYLGRGTLSNRQQKINHFVHLLSRYAEIYNCAAIATNQVMASPDVFFGDPTRPIGGNVVAHTSTYRIYFKKSGRKRIARMVDSPHHPEEEVLFALGEAGVMDLEDAEAAAKTKKTKSASAAAADVTATAAAASAAAAAAAAAKPGDAAPADPTASSPAAASKAKAAPAKKAKSAKTADDAAPAAESATDVPEAADLDEEIDLTDVELSDE